MSTAAAAPHPSRLQELKLDQIAASPTNPRKSFANMAELAASIGKDGILQPLLVRPIPDSNGQAFELVDGHRRLRAAHLAGLEVVPVQVRQFTDLEVLEMQLVANSQRDDVPPLEEAEGYRRLRDDFHLDVETIAGKVNKSVASVYARLKLCDLGKEARKALEAGALSPSTALLVARVPKNLQGKAVALLERRHKDDDPISYREARYQLERELLCRLGDAGFDTEDATLVPKAGACTTCPKRSGNQPQLFPVAEPADVCTDPTCFAGKRQAAWEKTAAEAKEKGLRVIGQKEAKKLLPQGYPTKDSGLEKLSRTDYQDMQGRTYEKVLGKTAPPVVAIAQDEQGRPVELVDAKALKKALREAQPEKARGEVHQARKADKGKEELRQAVAIAAFDRCATALSKRSPADGDFRLIASSLVAGHLDSNTVLDLAARRFLGVEPDEKDSFEVLDKAIPKLFGAEVKALIVLLAHSEGWDAYWFRAEKTKEFTALLASCKVDLKKVEAEVVKAKQPPAAAPPGKKAAPQAFSIKPTKKPASAKKKVPAKKGARHG